MERWISGPGNGNENERENEWNSWSMCRLCRLCAANHRGGSLLFARSDSDSDDPSAHLATLVNKYLPLQILDNDKLPRTICPGCNIQLEATVQFFELIISGQATLRELLKKQNASQKNESFSEDESFLIQVSEDGSVYASDHIIALKIQGLTKPKKRRGRPRKNVQEDKAIKENTIISNNANSFTNQTTEATVVDRKRKRVTPKRFDEAVQGKELKKILYEEGVTDDESDKEKKKKVSETNNDIDQIIGHIEYSDGVKSREMVIVNKSSNKKRKGRGPSIKRTCNICSLEFHNIKQYTAHVAIHHSVSQMNNELISRESHQIVNETVSTALDTLPLNDTSIDIVNLDVNTDTSYFVTGPSMPDISSEIIETGPVDKNDLNELIDTTRNIFSEQNINDPVTELITSSILPIATMPPEEMNKKIVQQVEPIPEILDDTKSEFNKYKCNECERLFVSKNSRNSHIKIVHRGEHKFKCPHCGVTFGYSITLKKHMLSHYPKSSRRFACDFCDKVFRHPSSVIYHKETQHNLGNRFVCKCGKVFKHRQLLVRHQAVHSEDRPFQCKLCSNSFKTKANLVNHEQTHLGLKKFQCNLCNQSFAHKGSLNVHTRLHWDEKPHKCDICNKNFRQAGHLIVHMRIHTGEKPFSCTICSRRFTTSSQYQMHLKNIFYFKTMIKER